MKTRRLVLCLLMAIAMTVTMIPGVSFADDGGSGESGESNLGWYVGEYDSNIVLMDGGVDLTFDVLDIETDEQYTGELTYQWYTQAGIDDEGYLIWDEVQEARERTYHATEIGNYVCEIYDDTEDSQGPSETVQFLVYKGVINKIELDVSAPVCGQEVKTPVVEDEFGEEVPDWDNRKVKPVVSAKTPNVTIEENFWDDVFSADWSLETVSPDYLKFNGGEYYVAGFIITAETEYFIKENPDISITGGDLIETVEGDDGISVFVKVKANHDSDSGTVTRAATTSAEGEKTFKCKGCGEVLRTEKIAKLPVPGSNPNQKGVDGTALGRGASAAAANKAITSSVREEGAAGSKYVPLTLYSTKQGNKNIRLNWRKVSGAKSYVVYGNQCGNKFKMKKLATVGGNSYNVTKIYRGLAKGTYHKFTVVALDAKKNVVSTSKVIHVATKGGKVGNPTKLKVAAPKKSRAVLKKGKTVRIKAKATGKKVKIHRGIAFESSNPRVATVAGNGTVKARAAGKATIFVYAQNGLYRTVSITVR